MRTRALKSLLLVGLIGCLGVLSGCITAEVKAAGKAVDAARMAGKDKQCPAEFQAAEQMAAQARALCNMCKAQEANAMANEAMTKVNALCPAKPTPAPEPVRTPPPAAAPTASLSAAPASVEQGGCANLNWSTTNASTVAIDSGVGSLDANGSKQVCPSSTTRYTLSATGAGGTRTDSTTVTVTPKAAPAPTARLTIHVNFDTSKWDIRKDDHADLQKAEAFVRKYPNCKIEVDGHTDSRGSDAYNQTLSERRAEAVKKFLLDKGAVTNANITTKGFGKNNPIADNATAKGRAENRRAEILIYCQ